MASNKKSFVLYTDLIHTVNQLPDDKAGLLFKHILSYVNDENPISDDIIVNISFEPIKQQLKRDLIKYEAICERNKINGQKGGRPKIVDNQDNSNNPKEPKKPSGLFGNPKKPKKPDNDNDIDIDNDNEIINNKLHLFKNSVYFDFEILKKEIDIKYHKYDLKYYHQNMIDYSESKGAKYKNWLATCRSWINRDIKEGKIQANNNGETKINKWAAKDI